MSSFVLDASALLALLQAETGSEHVAAAVTEGAAIGTVNLAEVIGKLSERGMPEAMIRAAIGALPLEIADFDSSLAFATGMLRSATKSVGLSLGDRACLALGQLRQRPVLTADHSWQALSIGIPVRVIR